MVNFMNMKEKAQEVKMNMKEKVQQVKATLEGHENVKIVAATKYLTVEQTKELYLAGIHDFGENRTDMFLEKYEALKDLDINWHFFGCVQNARKVKEIANKIVCLHSLDKLSIAVELDKRLEKPLDCFVQVNISEETNKQGILITRVKPFIKSLQKLKNIRIIGLMCIATMTYDTEILEKEFSKMQKAKEEIEALNLDYAPCHDLSMGMTNDYKIAMQYGATYIRLGRIFLK